MLHQTLKAGLALILAAVVMVMLNALDSGLGGKAKRERAGDIVLLAEKPEDPQRAIVLVRSSRLEAGELTVELELRNNSGEILTGHVWGQARLSSTQLVESRERLTFKARIKTFKTLRFPVPSGFAGTWQGLEILVLDDATGIATRYGAEAPKPAA